VRCTPIDTLRGAIRQEQPLPGAVSHAPST
jgi:hypothetical protein